MPAGTRYLIIAGTSKAASTSLHGFLAGHPEICPSSMKETRFFLDPDYPLPSKYRVQDGLDKYDEFFAQCGHRGIRLEATPDYLYSPGTPRRILDSLPAAQVVFVLRDPVSRLVSWFRFAKQTGRLPSTAGFREYVEQQMASRVVTDTPQPMRALEQGRYAAFLKPYYDLFGPQRILTLFFEELTAEPVPQITRLCAFAGISAAPFDTQEFGRVNQTVPVRSPGLHKFWVRARFELRKQTHSRPWIHRPLRGLRRLMEPLYLRLNRGAGDSVEVPSDLGVRLIDYYRPDLEQLGALLGVSLPWPTAKGTATGPGSAQRA